MSACALQSPSGPALPARDDVWGRPLLEVLPEASPPFANGAGAATFAWTALEGLLELRSEPMVIIAGSGRTLLQNSSARRLKAKDGAMSPWRWVVAARWLLDSRLGIELWMWARSDESELTDRVGSLARGWALTPRQTQVLRLLLDGECNKDIAQRLQCSLRTVELHASALLDKTGCASRTQLISKAWRLLWEGRRSAPHVEADA